MHDLDLLLCDLSCEDDLEELELDGLFDFRPLVLFVRCDIDLDSERELELDLEEDCLCFRDFLWLDLCTIDSFLDIECDLDDLELDDLELDLDEDLELDLEYLWDLQ